MAREFFKNLPDTTTPLTAPRLNGLLDGDEAMGNIVVDSISSKNMFNVGSVLSNTAISSGVIITNNDNDIYVIKVNANTKYTLSKTSYNGGVLGYYSTYPKIGDTLTNRQALANVSNLTITAQDNYLCLMIPKADNKSTIQVEKGESATTYAPYNAYGSNNFKNENIVVGSIRSKNMFNKENIATGLTYSSTGATTNLTNAFVQYIYIPVKPNTKYTIGTTTNYTSETDYRLQILEYNASKTFIQRNNLTSRTATITTTSNTYYVRLGASTITKDELQFEEGDSHTTYSPYQELDNQDLYSTSEMKIGTWIDGKPLYRKVFTGTTSSTDGLNSIQLTNTKIINSGGFIQQDNNLALQVNSTYGTDGTNSIRILRLDGNSIGLQCGTNGRGKTYEIWVEYTKN